MKHITLLTFWLSSFCLPALHAQHIEDSLQRLDEILDKHRHIHYFQSPDLGRADSVFCPTVKRWQYFDIDSICLHYIRKGGYNAIPNEMDYLDNEIFRRMSHERRLVL